MPPNTTNPPNLWDNIPDEVVSQTSTENTSETGATSSSWWGTGVNTPSTDYESILNQIVKVNMATASPKKKAPPVDENQYVQFSKEDLIILLKSRDELIGRLNNQVASYRQENAKYQQLISESIDVNEAYRSITSYLRKTGIGIHSVHKNPNIVNQFIGVLLARTKSPLPDELAD